MGTVAATPSMLPPPDVPAIDQPACLRGLQALVQRIPELNRAAALPSLQALVCRVARDMVGADGASFVRRDAGDCVYEAEDAISPLWTGRRFPLKACVSGWCMLQGEPVVISDVRADPRAPQTLYRPTFVQSLVMTPIGRSDPGAAIGCYWSVPREPKPHERWLLLALAEMVAVAMDRLQQNQLLTARLDASEQALVQAQASLDDLAVTDPLTGLLSRRELSRHAERCLNQARRNGHPLAVMVIALDNPVDSESIAAFAPSDELLQSVGLVLLAQARNSDVVARDSDYSFVMLLPDTPREAAAQHAARLQYRLRMLTVGGDVLTASIGISDYVGGQSGGLDDVLTRAYGALDRARQQGGDLTVVEPR